MKRIIDGMSAQQIADGCMAYPIRAIINRVELEDYLESLCKPEPNDEEYISRLERAVQVLVNSSSNWDMNVSVWDRELILSVMDYMSMAEMRIREKGRQGENDRR